MEFLPLTAEHYSIWNELCDLSHDAWFWHRSEWLEYILHYRRDLTPQSYSFLVLQDKKPVAICPLVLEVYKDHKEFSFGAEYGPPPAFANQLSSKEREKTMKAVFDHIDELAFEAKADRVRFRFPVLNASFLEKNLQSNYLLKFGFIDASLQTQILNLSLPIEELKRNVRHGHDSDIKKASKICSVEIFTKDNATREVFDGYMEMHTRANGKMTRPIETFDAMFSFLQEGNALLASASVEGKPISYAYFYMYKGNVYYGSSCNDPEHDRIPASHIIQWQVIEFLKNRGIHFYEIGWQQYPTLVDFPTDKQMAISRFKRGFGGVTAPLFRGEKYYNINFFKNVFEERIEQYSQMQSKTLNV